MARQRTDTVVVGAKNAPSYRSSQTSAFSTSCLHRCVAAAPLEWPAPPEILHASIHSSTQSTPHRPTRKPADGTFYQSATHPCLSFVLPQPPRNLPAARNCGGGIPRNPTGGARTAPKHPETGPAGPLSGQNRARGPRPEGPPRTTAGPCAPSAPKKKRAKIWPFARHIQKARPG